MDSIEQAHADINQMLPSNDSRFFTMEEIDSAINMSILDMFNQNYKNFGETLRISDQLARFKNSLPVPVSSGVGNAPTNLMYTLSMYATKIGVQPVMRKVRIVEEHFLPQFVDSEAFSYSETYIIASLSGNGVRLYPDTVTEIIWNYFRKPLLCKFAYTLTGVLNNIPVYDPLNSSQIDYHPAAYNQIIEKALLRLGVAQKDQMLVQQQSIAKVQNAPEVR